MTIDEAIEHAEEVARRNEHIADTFPYDGIANIEKCKECAEEHRQLAAWLRELKRLQSFSTHADVFDKDDYMFSYFECQGDAHISVYRDGHEPVQFLQSAALNEPFSREQFVEWCEEYTRRNT